MSENLIAGYLAYTTAEEFGASAVGGAPATTPTVITTIEISVSVSVLTASASVSANTATDNC
jgi:hypothetical protein